ncbi:DMT family transporter [Colwellia hornerae]|uniref:DMT family transporter n=1 Tax=Colwellia hornerae TaxID=89402 RepID=A0A5C6QQU6_9GAMM|nr:DMT family transporter [Colwellia hornerae]TWX55732.1 DMT family transporter [Colwellia hornerae]TWX61942.1 DMT family transporter [Colwellia hornerae]TWX71274.1 DMT family transporter [Colwellia hornerae]
MSVPIAYFAVILIWSTTPLAIVWSSETIHPTLAVLLRMLIAVVPGWLILKAFRIELPWHKKALKLYSFSAIGIFGGMLFAYLAAGYISSGLMSLMFGLAPILSGVLSKRILAESAFSPARKIALAVAICGLAMVCFDKISLKDDAYIGIVAVLIAVSFFSFSGVLVKSVDVAINPMATTVGSLLFSIPLFTLVWFIFDGNIPYELWSNKSILSVVYLGVIGSLVGFIAYFYVLQRLKASTVALITMITPVIAISLGLVLNNETVNTNLIVGGLAIIAGLAIYQWGDLVIKYNHNKYAQ